MSIWEGGGEENMLMLLKLKVYFNYANPDNMELFKKA